MTRGFPLSISKTIFIKPDSTEFCSLNYLRRSPSPPPTTGLTDFLTPGNCVYHNAPFSEIVLYHNLGLEGGLNFRWQYKEFLTDLRKHHGISIETIYNDIHGFITYQNIHANSYIAFYMGLTFQNRGFKAKTKEKRQKEYKEAIKHYSTSIEITPHPVPIINRAECWLHLEEWNKARDEFNTAIEMGWEISAIIELFRNDYENVAAFEKKTGSKMPEDLAKMLGG